MIFYGTIRRHTKYNSSVHGLNYFFLVGNFLEFSLIIYIYIFVEERNMIQKEGDS